ncbi:putative DNA-binding transcriptional regulator YafY [Kibdelosporangium banguiense]|uniref:DNA-binding transcriptional regulator YafY n=1 Tax=Kibdelosporangium banguiense TaxID=1365924 RepID=A0ABS4TTN7_9PSEU|nr:WYL domain-containing protein [Kibdelosporangium banguiense]MBP2327772.1 putative DNA-binding transcriptional regulator YafY [Kibdelosporangium banguiense]
MTDTAARLLKLLSLLQTPREWPGSELAERLDVSARTVRRDIERLRDLGYPVEATMGAEGGYRLVAGTAIPPLLLDEEEAVAITVGLRIASGHAVNGIDEASVRALTKLERVLPTRLRRRVAALGSATVPLLTGDSPTVQPETLTGVATAIANHERLRFAYQDNTGAETKRLAEPHSLVSASRRWYLVAFDNDRDDWRIFRLDRMDALWPTGARFVPRELPATDAASYVTSKLYSIIPTYQAVATLHAPMDKIAHKVGTSLGELTPIDDRTCSLRSHTDTLEWLAFRLTMLGCEFEVHGPPELAEYLRAFGARATRAAGQRS